MIDMEDRVYKNKFTVKAALGYLRVAQKVSKLNTQEELAKLKPEIEQYKASPEYKHLLDELKKKDDDDEYRNDSDPKGYDLYEKFVSQSLCNTFFIAARPYHKGS